MLAEMILHDLIQEAVDGSARGGDPLERDRAIRILGQGPLNRFHLSGDPPDAVDQLLLVCCKVCYTHGAEVRLTKVFALTQ